jgi:choline dehydrogenase-like flavoprotein
MSALDSPRSSPDCEYLVVGSGAGGGTVAARLAEAGKRVILLEAGGDPRELIGGDPVQPDVNRLPHDYDVPAFHAFASENTAMSWDFFVRHYDDDARQRRDPKFVEHHRGTSVNGIYYPRAGTLGGCTAHNAMILVYPHNADWDFHCRSSPATQAGLRRKCGPISSGSKTAAIVVSIGSSRSSVSIRHAMAGADGCPLKPPSPWKRCATGSWRA